MGVSQNYGYLFGGPHNKDCSILGSILRSPYLGNYHIESRKPEALARKEFSKAILTERSLVNSNYTGYASTCWSTSADNGNCDMNS